MHGQRLGLPHDLLETGKWTHQRSSVRLSAQGALLRTHSFPLAMIRGLGEACQRKLATAQPRSAKRASLRRQLGECNARSGGNVTSAARQVEWRHREAAMNPTDYLPDELRSLEAPQTD